MKYFLHDSNAFNDDKISELFIQFGYEGIGLFFTILEKLAAQEKPVKTLVLKKQLKIGKRLEKCWNFLEEIELISSNNGETFNERLMNFAGKYKIKNEKNAKRISEWREKQLIKKNVTCYDTVTERVRNTDKVNRSKVNKSKEINKDVYGSEKNIFLRIDELEKLRAEYNGQTEKAIEYLSLYKKEKEYTTKSDYLTIKRWVIDAVKKQEATNNQKTLFTKPSNFINHDSDF